MTTVIEVLLALALFTYVWNNRSAFKEFLKRIANFLQWCKTVVKPLLYATGVILVVWTLYTGYWEYELARYVKAHPAEKQIVTWDREFYSARATLIQRLNWGQYMKDRSAKLASILAYDKTDQSVDGFMMAIKSAREQGYSQEEIDSYFNGLPRLSPDAKMVKNDRATTTRQYLDLDAFMASRRAAKRKTMTGAVKKVTPKVATAKPNCPDLGTYSNGTWEDRKKACDETERWMREHGESPSGLK